MEKSRFKEGRDVDFSGASSIAGRLIRMRNVMGVIFETYHLPYYLEGL